MRGTRFLACLLAAQAGSSLAVAAGPISGPMVVSDAWPEASDLAVWANDVLRIEGKSKASDRDKAIALFAWTRLFVVSVKSGTEPSEGPYGEEARLELDVNRSMFVHGGGDCDYQARALEAVWCAYKKDDFAARKVSAVYSPHSMAELMWGGTWHGFDPLNGVYFVDRDGRDGRDGPLANVLGFEQTVAAEDLLRANEHFEHRARPFFERVRPWDGPGEWKSHLDFERFFATRQAWDEAGRPDQSLFAEHSMPSTYALSDMDWYLPRGTVVTRHWRPGPIFFCPESRAQFFGLQGRHYRQALEWGPSLSHWSSEEDPFGFSKVEAYLERVTDPADADFYGMHTFFPVSTGTLTYEADLWSDTYLDAVEGNSEMARHEMPPYLRPDAAGAVRGVTFRVRSPMIIADAVLDAAMARGPAGRARLLLSTDGGVTWEEVASGDGEVKVNLGKSRFNGRQQSVSGKYDYLVRFEALAEADPASAGLSRLRLTTWIDGSLNALPRLSAGANNVRIKVRDAALVEAPIRVEYRWTAAQGPGVHRQTLQKRDFASNIAAYRLSAPALIRNESVAFAYGSDDEDGNGLADGWERHFFGGTGQDAGADPDGDGRSNAQAFAMGVAPLSRPAPAQAASRTSSRGSGGCSAASGGPAGWSSVAVASALGAIARMRCRRGARGFCCS